MAIACLGERLWWERFACRRAAMIDPSWDRKIWRWSRHMLERMVDRHICMRDLMHSLAHGTLVLQRDGYSWRVHDDDPHRAQLCIVIRRYLLDLPAVDQAGHMVDHGYLMTTCWNTAEDVYLDIVWNMSMEDICNHLHLWP